MRSSALSRIVRSLFGTGSPVSVVAALLDSSDLKISVQELDQLKVLIADKEAKARHSQS